MKKFDLSRALRDPQYRASLTDAQRAMLPAHPAGETVVEDDALRSVAGGCGPFTTFISSCVPPGYHCP